MLTHYRTLQALARTFNERLRGATLREIFTQQRSELLVHCATGNNAWTLCISCDPKLNYIFLRDPIARAKKNSVDLFPDAAHKAIETISVHDADRIFQTKLEDGSMLCFFPHGVTANVLLINQEKRIIDAFKRRNELVGKTFEVTRTDNSLEIPDTAEAFESALKEKEAKTVFAALKSLCPALGSTLSREVLHRSRVDETTPVSELSSDEIAHTYKSLKDVLEALKSPSPTLYYRGETPRVFSLIQLDHFGGSRAASFPDVNEAVRTFIIQTFRTRAIDREKNVLLSKIKGTIERSQRALAAVREELQHSSRSDEYERLGKIIMANLQHLTKGTKVVDLPDLFSGDRLTRIALDPKLTPAQNASRYFEKAKKARQAQAETERREGLVKKQLMLLEKLQLHLDSCQTREQLKEFENEYKKDLVDLKLVRPGKPGEEIPFRVFTVTGGFQVWVGKNAENNDLLTTKYAKPGDLWFHARGGSGSHVVLKVGTASGNPSKKAIEETAAIAAYYSKMRNAKMVPVAYCDRKYVRKSKGAPAGTVTLEREKVLFAEPSLPAGSRE